MPQQRGRNIALGVLGGVCGFLAALIFWAIYFLQTFSAPVSQGLKLESAGVSTVLIFLVIIGVLYHKQIRVFLAETTNAAKEE